MLKKLLSNKIVLVFTIIILITGISLCFVLSQDSKTSQKDKPHVEQGEHEDNVSEQNGLEIKEEVDENVDSIDGSGSWDESINNDNKTDDNTVKDNASSDSKEDDEQEKSDSETEDEILDGDILEDDKEWSPIS